MKRKTRFLLTAGLACLILQVQSVSFSQPQDRADNSKNMESVSINELRQAAKGGNAQAQTELGQRYVYRKGGVDQNYAEARSWFLKAADQGNDVAALMMGYIYEFGWSVTPDLVQARTWFEKAGNEGNGRALVVLAYFYEDGQGVPRDYAHARSLYQKAADSGYAPGEFYYAGFLQRGLGGPRDIDEARALYQKAADQGFAPAQWLLEKGVNASAAPAEE
jgi:uncharacterized protein